MVQKQVLNVMISIDFKRYSKHFLNMNETPKKQIKH